MSDYKSKLEELQEAARRKARELDEKLHLKERLGEGAKAAQDVAKDGFRAAQQAAQDSAKAAQDVLKEGGTLTDAVRQGARVAQETAKEGAQAAQDTFKEGVRLAQDAAQTGAATFSDTADKIRAQAERADESLDFRERAREATAKMRQAGATANTAFAGAQKIYNKAGRAYGVGAGLKRASDAALSGARQAANWAQENPARAGMVTASIVIGLPLGMAFPRLDAILFGAHPHWLTHSSLPVYGLRKAGEKFDEYLQRQEKLVAEGKLSEAEQSRVEFERNIVKYVGAPLLGAFSCATGVALWAQIFQPGRLVGAPIDWLFGGNPVFDGIWLFGNGVLCFHQGYKFFMIALADQEEVQRAVREIKGLLPAYAQA